MAKDVISQILDFINDLFGTKKPEESPLKLSNKVICVTTTPLLPIEVKPVLSWDQEKDSISCHFSVKDAIYLPTWKRMAVAADGLDTTIEANLIMLFRQMDVVRDHFGKPIRVHVSYRPTEYNKAIGGALHSAHSDGLACDFDIIGMACDEVRTALTADDNKLLEDWKMRCEDAPGTNWVHLDLRELAPGGHRFFKP